MPTPQFYVSSHSEWQYHRPVINRLLYIASINLIVYAVSDASDLNESSSNLSTVVHYIDNSNV